MVYGAKCGGKVASKTLDFREKKAYTARIHFNAWHSAERPAPFRDTEDEMQQTKPVTVVRALLYEVPKTIFWTFPIAFAVGLGLGLVIGIPILLGLEVNTDLERFGL